MSRDARERGGGETLVAEDDAIIGRAFRASMVVIVVLGAGIAALVWFFGREGAQKETHEIETAAPVQKEIEAELPALVFTDVTASAGIDFSHENGAFGDKLLPETMGSGAAFLDYDDDGDADLLLVNSNHWPGELPEGEPPATMALYAGDGSGKFENVTAAVGLDVSFYGMGIAVGDYDCDGDSDLYFTAVGPNRMFRNDGNRFTEVDAGVAGAEDAWSTCAAFFDADGDGDLDLYVGNYVRWSREIDLALDFRLTGLGRAYGPPMDFEGVYGKLYRNEGDGHFSDISSDAGIQVDNPASGTPVAKALGCLPVDADEDGDLDLFVANDTVQNHYFKNRGDGTFEEVGADLGLAYDRNGKATGAMGVDAAWYRDDGALGIAIGNFANEMSSLYVTQGGRGFADEAIPEGLGAPSRAHLSFGVFFFDVDLDGRLDLLQANGHIEADINQVQPSQHHAQPAQLFWNAGAGHRRTLIQVPSESLGPLAKPIVGRGGTYADIDGDGDLDVLLTQAGGAPLLLRNDQTLGHHWLRIRLRGSDCNPRGIGARVELEAGGELQRRVVMPTRSYLSQVESTLTFGLGSTAAIERLRVTWPDGSQREWSELAVDRVHDLSP